MLKNKITKKGGGEPKRSTNKMSYYGNQRHAHQYPKILIKQINKKHKILNTYEQREIRIIHSFLIHAFNNVQVNGK